MRLEHLARQLIDYGGDLKGVPLIERKIWREVAPPQSAIERRVMEDVHLICCIGISLQEHFSRPFFVHFLQHYLGLGIPRANIHLTLHTRDEEDPNLKYVCALLSEYEIGPRFVFVGPYDCWAFYHYNYRILDSLPAESWAMMVDFDELIFFPGALATFVTDVEASGCDVVMGRFVDRIAKNGALPEIGLKQPIWDQFPVKYPVTRRIVGACDTKTCIFRSHLHPCLGHHKVAERDAKTFPEVLPVFHFKWDSTLALKLEMRRDQFRADPARFPWNSEIERLMAHISTNKLVIPKTSAGKPL